MPRPASKHEYWMRKAVDAAVAAEKFGHRPFGAIVVDSGGNMVTFAHGTGVDADPLRHSECVAITDACRILKGLLEGCTLYSTHEPCHMCAGAILHSHISEVVWGSYREDLPQLFRYYDVPTEHILADCGHMPKATGGVLREECVALFERELSELANARAGF